jgi:hypothetical protein
MILSSWPIIFVWRVFFRCRIILCNVLRRLLAMHSVTNLSFLLYEMNDWYPRPRRRRLFLSFVTIYHFEIQTYSSESRRQPDQRQCRGGHSSRPRDVCICCPRRQSLNALSHVFRIARSLQ